MKTEISAAIFLVCISFDGMLNAQSIPWISAAASLSHLSKRQKPNEKTALPSKQTRSAANSQKKATAGNAAQSAAGKSNPGTGTKGNTNTKTSAPAPDPKPAAGSQPPATKKEASNSGLTPGQQAYANKAAREATDRAWKNRGKDGNTNAKAPPGAQAPPGSQTPAKQGTSPSPGLTPEQQAYADKTAKEATDRAWETRGKDGNTNAPPGAQAPPSSQTPAKQGPSPSPGLTPEQQAYVDKTAKEATESAINKQAKEDRERKFRDDWQRVKEKGSNKPEPAPKDAATPNGKGGFNPAAQPSPPDGYLGQLPPAQAQGIQKESDEANSAYMNRDIDAQERDRRVDAANAKHMSQLPPNEAHQAARQYADAVQAQGEKEGGQQKEDALRRAANIRTAAALKHQEASGSGVKQVGGGIQNGLAPYDGNCSIQ